MHYSKLGIVLVVIAMSAHAEPVCDSLARAVEDGQKELSFYSIPVLMEGQAAELLRAQERTNVILQIQSNLTLMQAGKCVLPKLPIDDHAYWDGAWKCRYAHTNESSNDPVPECARATWKRGAK